MIKNLTQKFRELSFDKYIMRLLAAWCFSSLLFNILGGATLSIEYAAGTSLLRAVLVFVICYEVLRIFGRIFRKHRNADAVILVVCFGLYTFLTILEAESWYYSLGMSALAAILAFYLCKNDFFTFSKPFTDRRKLRSVLVIFSVFVLIVGLTAVLRYRLYYAPNYDFGIFCNMFYNMRRTFVPFTTCERDMVLSHFAVHVSPIFYVLLPLYFIFPSPVTLEIVQPLILASAVFPAMLLAEKYGLSERRTAVLCFITVFHPAIVSGTNYDLHENCFLFPLLLWVFYFFETDRYILLAVFTLLTLTVKEDAAVYIVFFALYAFIGKRKHLTAVCLAAGALAYFFTVLFLLTKYGNGVMSDRYDNYLPNGGSLIEVVKNVFIDPGYVFSQLLVDKEGNYAAKLLFLLQVTAPFAFLPFAVKRVSELLLLLPMVLLNLMPVYVYQYDIGFQYHFGVMAFLVYLSVINLSSMKKPSAKKFLCAGAAVTAVLFAAAALPRAGSYLAKYASEAPAAKVMDEALEQIPDDASVICSTYLLPKLSRREEIYEEWYHVTGDTEDADYVILDKRFDHEKYVAIYKELGYTDTQTISYEGRDLMLIMRKPAE